MTTSNIDVVETKPKNDIEKALGNKALKGDQITMEYPFFSLNQKTEHRVLEFKNERATVTILPGALGLPTIMDKDILIYCMSIYMEKLNAGEKPTSAIRFFVSDYLKATGRSTSGDSYKSFKIALDRFNECSIRTNFKIKKRYISSGTSLINSYHYIDADGNIYEGEKDEKGRVHCCEINLSDWVIKLLLDNNVLKLNDNYLKIKKPLEKRLYEIARKHCGHQPEFKISLQKLYEKSGSSAQLKKFKENFRAMIEVDPLPDYRYYIDKDNMVTIENKKPILGLEKDEIEEAMLSLLRPSTISHAKEIYNQSLTDWRFNEISNQFLEYNANKKNKPKDLDKAFIGFVKKKVQTFDILPALKDGDSYS